MGGWGGLGLTSDQCFSHSAPWEIQRRTRSISASASLAPFPGGGIRSLPVAEILRSNSLWLGEPGTTGCRPPSRLACKPAAVSRRRPVPFLGPPLRLLASGPWQVRQLAARSARTSAKDTRVASWAVSGAQNSVAGRLSARALSQGLFGRVVIAEERVVEILS